MERILAIDPASRGFGFAVLEGQNRLVDWGVKDVRRNKRPETLRKVEELTQFYNPDAIIVEDCLQRASRRRERVQDLIENILDLARQNKITVRRIPLSTVRRFFSETGDATKHQIATTLADRFPELALRLPRKRKPWESEHHSMSIFDATALGLVSFYRSVPLQRPTSG